MARADYAADPVLLERVLELLGVAFGPWVAEQERLGRRWGMRWERCSTPFVLEDEGRVVGHLGVMQVPVVLDGVRRTIGALHAGAVHPEHRGRGHLRTLMEEALEWCSGRVETCALAGEVALYERFGFRHVREHRCVGPAPQAPPSTGAPLRTCRIDDPADVELWQRLLTCRAPVSQRAGIVADVDVFCFQAAHLPIRYAPDLDALLDFELEGHTLRLYDVVAPRMPRLAELVGVLGRPVEQVVVHFAPDQLDADLAAEPHDLGTPDDPDTWMVRGPWTAEPFLWPRTARW